jgi:hypothetical protein
MISREQILGSTGLRRPMDGVLPYGRWMILPSFLMLLAFILSMIASFHCTFFIVHQKRSQGLTGFGFQHTTEGSIEVGIWRTQEDWAYAPLANRDEAEWNNIGYATDGWDTYDEAWIAGSPKCVEWSFASLGKMPDRPVKFTRMVSVLLVLLGAPLVLLMLAYTAYHPLCGIPPDRFAELSDLPQRQNWPEISLVHVMTVACLVEGLLTLILLSVLATDACSDDAVDSCKLSGAGYMSILGSFTWWGAMVALWLVGHNQPAAAASTDSNDRTSTRDDGPKIVTKKGPSTNDNSDQESTESSSEDEKADNDEEKGEESGSVADDKTARW